MTKYALFETAAEAAEYTAEMVAMRTWEKNVTYSTVPCKLPGCEGWHVVTLLDERVPDAKVVVDTLVPEQDEGEGEI